MTYRPSRILHRDPAAEPLVSTPDLAAHLRVDHLVEDAYIATLLDAAISFFEFETKTIIRPSTLRMKLDHWPTDRVLTLPRPPFRAIDCVQYIDPAGQTQILSGSSYEADPESRPGRVRFADELPEVYNRFGAITVDWFAGYGPYALGESTEVPEMLIQGIKLLVGTWYENRADVSDRRVNPTPIAVDRIIDHFKHIEVPG